MGTPVKAPATATVVFAGSGGEYGLAVILDHGNEVKSLYGHLSKIHVNSGPARGARLHRRAHRQHRPQQRARTSTTRCT